MTVPERSVRRSGRIRAFDLRATALFFALAAILLVAGAYTARAALAAAERRPAWAVVLCLIGTAAAALAVRRRRRRGHLARRTARRAAAALQEGAMTALDALETPPEQAPAVVVPAQAGPGGRGAPLTEDTVVLADPVVDYGLLDPYEFEQAVAALCERDGCAGVEVSGGAGDLGADVLAVAPDGRRVVVQCKRYCATNRVGSEDLQRFGGTCYTVHEADLALFVTTSDFTAPAVEYAEQCGIVCVDGEALKAWSDGAAPPPWAVVSPVPPPVRP
ncbi:restriction endonuclease [Streptomyces seoulensis]|nr:restriction endonuclease [Streptomyces seoulensis]